MLFRVYAEIVGYYVLFGRCHYFTSVAMDSTIAEWLKSFATVVKNTDMALLACH